MTTSESVNEIATALAKAQGEMKNAPFNATNPHLKNKFANLASVRDTTVPTLSKHGIAVVQTIVPLDGRAALATRLIHSSGQWMESLCPLPDVQDMQKMGSALTYARRYSLSAICGIAADEDDDAEATMPRQEYGQKTSATPPAGYAKWIGELETFAAKHTDGELMSEISESGSPECKAYLRTDTVTLTRLRSLGGRNKKAVA